MVWTGLRQSVPSKLYVNIQNFKTVIDLENYKCKNYYTHLIKFIYEKPRKWDKLSQEFYLREDQLSEVYLLPLRVACEPYVRSFQYKVLNYILYTNDHLFKYGTYQIQTVPFVKRIEKPFIIFYLNALFPSVFGIWYPLVY